MWSEQQELTPFDGGAAVGFGSSVSVGGNTVIIGAPGEGGQGAAHVFVLSGGVWIEQQRLIASDGMAWDFFGESVSVSGDTVMIGADGTNDNLGATYVFVRSGGRWTQQQELAASDGAANDQFGVSVFVSGDTVVIGAQGKNLGQGAAYVFVQSGGVWSQQKELTASDGTLGNFFGFSVSLSGDTAVIGHSIGYGFQGAAYVFVRSGGAWSQEQELTAGSGGAVNEFFGFSVSVSGGTAVIGAPVDGGGYVFALTQPTITGVGVSGGGADIAQNSWVEIYGANLAPASVGAGGLTWSAEDFVFSQMPTQLGNVSATVDGKPAYVSFIGPTQVNVLTPLDSAIGPVAVVVNNDGATSAAFTANLQPVSPGFLRVGDGIHIAAEHSNYKLLGPASMSVPGYTFTPATPGETILLFGDGFGLPVSTLTAGSPFQTGPLPTWPQVTIGGATATVQYAGLIGPGLYQINVVVPSTADAGDNQVIATHGGVSSPAGAMIPVSR
jgi:uncharacterized protein (TIGR03437 family)